MIRQMQDPTSVDSIGSSIPSVKTWCAFVLPGYALFVSWLDPALPWPVTFSQKEPWELVLLNLIPVLILHAGLLVITRRLLLSSWLTVLALGVLYFVNYLKLRELATPLLPDDFQFLKTIGVNYTFFGQYLASSRLQLLLAVLALAVTCLLSRETPVGSLKGAHRWGAAIGTVVLWNSLVQGNAPWKTIYDPGRLQFEPWAPRDSAARAGLITNMLLLHWELSGITKGEIDIAAARAQLHDHGLDVLPPVATEPRSPLPDIIILQSESLFDVNRLNGIAVDVMPTMEAASSRAWSGDLYVPTFGGGTIRTEFEVLTALPLAAFPQVRYPYLQLNRGEIPSIAWELQGNGYRTLAIHPNGGAFWNRNYAFRALGFERFLDGDAFADAEHYGWYVSDSALIDRIIGELSDDGPPEMIMAISIQNHGPYDTVPLPTPDRLDLASAVLDEPSANALQTYVALLRASDIALGRLLDFVDSRPRDTLLLVYGDHLPSLNGVFAQLGFRDDRSAEEQPVPWLLFDNRSRESRVHHGPAWLLPTVLVEKTSLRTTRYFSVLTNLGFAANTPAESLDAIKVLAQLQYAGRLESALTDDP